MTERESGRRKTERGEYVMRMMIKSRQMMKIMMMKARRRQEEDVEEEGRDRRGRGGTREDCEGCDRGQTEKENRDSPPGFCCLFQLTPQTPKQTHTHARTHGNTHWLSAASWCQFIFSVVGCLEQPHF